MCLDHDMSKIERICPNCGTSNPSDRARCARCGTNLTTLPARRPNNLPIHIDKVSAAALVLGASAFIARQGLRLFARQVLPRVVKGLTPKSAPKPTPKREIEPPVQEQPDYILRGWRTWSVRRGDEEAHGTEHFEWRINRRGAGRPKE